MTVDSDIVDELEDRLGDEPRAALPAEELYALCGLDASPDEDEARRLAERLHADGVGFEPDPRFCPAWPTAGTDAVLFRLGDGAPGAPSPAYTSAQVAVGLAMVVATADAEVSDAEREAIQERLSSSLQLVAAENERLRAHERWLLLNHPRPNLAAAHARIAKLERDRRLEIGRFVAFVAAVDGRIDPREREWLARCFRALDLSEEDLDANLDAIGGIEREWEYADEAALLEDPEEVLDLLLEEQD